MSNIPWSKNYAIKSNILSLLDSKITVSIAFSSNVSIKIEYKSQSQRNKYFEEVVTSLNNILQINILNVEHYSHPTKDHFFITRMNHEEYLNDINQNQNQINANFLSDTDHWQPNDYTGPGTYDLSYKYIPEDRSTKDLFESLGLKKGRFSGIRI